MKRKFYFWEEYWRLREIKVYTRVTLSCCMLHVILNKHSSLINWYLLLRFMGGSCMHLLSCVDCYKRKHLLQVLRKLNHPNIVKLKEVIRENDEVFLIFEYMVRKRFLWIYTSISCSVILFKYLFLGVYESNRVNIERYKLFYPKKGK